MQKILMIMASGDAPDLIQLTSAHKDEFFKLAGQGALLSLDDLIATNGQDYIKNLKDPSYMNGAKFEGKTYAFPGVTNNPAVQGIFARLDWLEELGLAVPKTLEEYYNVLKTIKEKKKISPFGATASGNYQGDFFSKFEGFFAAYGLVVMGSNSAQTIEKNGKLEFSFVQPEVVEVLTYLKKMYDEGILDKEFVTAKDTTLNEKFIAEKVGLAHVYYWSAKTIVDALATKNPKAKLGYIDPPVTKDGKPTGFVKGPPIQYYMVVPKVAKEPEAAVKLMNMLSSPELMEIVKFGLKDVHYTVGADGVRTKTDLGNETLWLPVYQYMTESMKLFEENLQASPFKPYILPVLKLATVEEKVNYAPPIDAWDTKRVPLMDYAQENFIKFVMGQRPLSEFSKFVEEFNAQGGTDAINAMNEWYDKFEK